MYTLLVLGVASFLLSLAVTPAVRNLFLHLGVVDRPDEDRKLHSFAVPRVGGIAILLSSLGGLGLLLLAGLKGGGLVERSLPMAFSLLPAAGLMFLVGLYDDLKGLTAWQKLGGQVVATGVAFWGGVRVLGSDGPGFGEWWSLPLTIGWLLLCTNAMNLIDGVDGLAAGVGLFAATTTLLAALLQNNFALAAATVPLVGSLLGFLRYNFNPATIFLGDSGSLLVGFLLGCYSVLWSQKSATILGMTAPIMALAIPLLDTGLAIVRRYLSSRPIFEADRGHIHHRLLDRGFTPRRVALVLYGVCGIAALFSLFLTNQGYDALVISGFCAVAWVGVRQLGYVEFGVLGQLVRCGAFRSMLGSQIAMHNYERKLAEATTPQQVWQVIEKAAREFGFSSARMILVDETFEFSTDADPGAIWTMNVALADRGMIELSHSVDSSYRGAVAPFASMLHRNLATWKHVTEPGRDAYLVAKVGSR